MSGPSAPPLRWVASAPGKPVPSAKILPLLRAAVDAAPERLDLRLRLARALFYADRLAELIAWLEPYVSDDAAAPELLYRLGCAASAVGDELLALSALRRAADSGFTPAFGYLAEVLLRLGRTDDALNAGLRGLEASPAEFKALADFKALGVVARILLASGDLCRLWDVCAELRQRGQWGAYFPSAMAHAATSDWQCAEVAALLDRARWFSSNQLTGSADLKSGLSGNFNAQLCQELLTHPSLRALPSIRATTGAGSRIDQLHLESGPLARKLLLGIRAAVDAYVAERQSDTGHPMIARRPETVSLNCWAVAVQRDGHEAWHIHPGGWISGVYYVAVPNQDVSDGSAGAIEFGPMPFGTERESLAWPRWRIPPQPGQLLLFPSYYGHRTWPTGHDDPRLIVAFDVVSAATEPVEAR
jgi:hypothetical protein